MGAQAVHHLGFHITRTLAGGPVAVPFPTELGGTDAEISDMQIIFTSF